MQANPSAISLFAARESALIADKSAGTPNCTVFPSKMQSPTSLSEAQARSDAMEPALYVHGTLDMAHSSACTLCTARFNMKNVSILGKKFSSEEHARNPYAAGHNWREFNSSLFDLWGSEERLSTSIVPDVGVVCSVGKIGLALIEALVDFRVAGDSNSLKGRLDGIGMSRTSFLNCATYLSAGCVLIIAHGAARETAHARRLLGPVQTFSSPATRKRFDWSDLVQRANPGRGRQG
jgi:hypothetical protein